MTKMAAVVAASLLLMACGGNVDLTNACDTRSELETVAPPSSTTLHYYLSTAWTDAEADKIITKMATWSSAVDVRYLGRSEAFPRSVAHHTVFVNRCETLTGGGRVGQTFAEAHVISLTPASLNGVVAHEAGHALGLAHSTARNWLMYPNNGGERPTAPSEGDFEDLQKLQEEEK